MTETYVLDSVREWSHNAVSIDPIDFEKAESDFARLYKLGGLDAPKIIVVDTPDELARRHLMDREIPTHRVFEVFEQYDLVFNGLFAGYSQTKESVGSTLSRVDMFIRSRYFQNANHAAQQQQRMQEIQMQQWAQQRNAVNQFGALQQQGLGGLLGSTSPFFERTGTAALPPPVHAPHSARSLGKERQNLLSFIELAKNAAGYSYLMRCGQDGTEDWNILIDLAQNCFWALLYEKTVIMCARPSRLKLDQHWNISCEDGPALAWGGGMLSTAEMLSIENPSNLPVPIQKRIDFYALAGVDVPKRAIVAPESYSAKEIMDEMNQEVRRLLVKRYKGGPEKWMKDAGGRKMHQDSVGILWCLERRWERPLQMVEVLNSTPEPDGSVRTYFLRVPPEIKTAREGIAWTFNMTEKEYILTAQS